MKRRNFTSLSALALVTCLGAVSCAQPSQPTSEAAPNADTGATVELTISVAASVQGAMKEVQEAYLAEAPDVSITYNFGSSGFSGPANFPGGTDRCVPFRFEKVDG